MKKIDYAALFTLRADGRYMWRWTDKAGKRHAVYDWDPEALYEKMQAVLHPSETPPTFRDMADAWERDHVEALSRGTQSTYRAPLRSLREFLGEIPITDVSAAHLNQILLAEKAKGYSYKHAALTRSVFKQIMDYAIADMRITVNPASAIHVPRGMKKGRVEAPEDDQLSVIKAALNAPFGDFVAVLLYTGLRTEEAVALRWEDVDLKAKTIRVHAAVDLHGTPLLKETKTEAGERTVPILPQLRPYLKMPKGAKKDALVFHKDGKLLTRGEITSRWLNWCKAAGLAEQVTFENRHRGKRECCRTEWRPLITPHQLRHNYATVLFEQEVDVLTAKDIMGHKDIATTQKIYTSLRQKHRDQQVVKIAKGF